MKVNFNKLHKEFLEAGMKEVRARELVKQIKQDMRDWPQAYTDDRNRNEMLQAGFLPGRKYLFGESFNEATRNNYYADFDYFMAHPLNNHFAIWINDKLTLKYMLNVDGLKNYIPEYYLYVENDGHYSYLMDSPAEVDKDADYLLNLLKAKKHLALKPNNGAGGKGFFGLEYSNDTILKNGTPISIEEFNELKSELNGYIVTEFIEQIAELDDVLSGTDCALRIILYKTVSGFAEQQPDYKCLIAYGRFGSSRSDSASNLCHGGLAVRINWDTGEFEGGFRGNTEFWGSEGAAGFDKHPDTKIAVDGMPIPNWDIVRNGLLSICNYLSSLDFFGMDVIITQDGFKLCEINSAPSTGLGQFHQGKCCLDDEDARSFVESKKRAPRKSFIDCFNASLE